MCNVYVLNVTQRVLVQGEDVFRKSGLNREVSVRENQGGEHGPHVDGEAEPRRDDLDPDGAHVGRDGLDGDALARRVPVGQGHHHVERGEGEHGVEEGPVVAHAVLLVPVGVGRLGVGGLIGGLGEGDLVRHGEPGRLAVARGPVGVVKFCDSNPHFK